MNVTMAEVIELVGLAPPEREVGHIYCPFHDEETPSCAVWDGDDPHWHCFGCNAGGGPIDFVARFVGGSRWKAVDAIRKGVADVDDRPNRTVEKRELLDLSEELESRARDAWADSRKVAAEFVAEKWPHLTLAQLEAWGVRVGRYNLLIPHFGPDGIVRGIKTRSFTGGTKGKKGSVTGSCFTTRLYRVGHERPNPAWSAVLVEGESDTWTMTLHFGGDDGVQVYGLPSGAGCWKPEFKAELLKHAHVYLFLDSDHAGQSAARTIGKDLGQGGPFSIIGYVPEGKDVTEAYLDGWRPQL